MAYIGTIGKRLNIVVTFKKSFDYVDYKFNRYGTRHYTHIFEDAEGNTIVWKTTSLIEYIEDDECKFVLIEGSKLELTGTVKEHSLYKGTEQTVVTRCKFNLIELAKTKVQIEHEQAEVQKATIGESDLVWEMPYRQYKEHYSDCETIIGSFDRHEDSRGFTHGEPTIKVIIREGRLKKSGVRGEHFHAYQLYLTDEKGKEVYCTYRAICFENAVKQHMKNCKQNGYAPVYENGEVKTGRIFL